VTAAPAETPAYVGRTAWARNLAAPVRAFLSTETGGAVALLAATVIALMWANSPMSDSYESLWSTQLAIRIGDHGIAADLHTWVNEGLMTLFFLVVGLEAKRELDLGELRERTRLTIPAFAAIGGMIAPVLIYLAFNAGGSGAQGWGTAMSTDTAFALGALALLTPRAATRTRVFLLSLAVVDDLGALLVIALFYTNHVSLIALAIAAGFFGVILALRSAPPWRRPVAFLAAVGMWGAMYFSGVDPVISGLLIGLATSAYQPSRENLERATAAARSFREQPTPELARSAQREVLSAISANERLQYELHPWTSYVIVPLFGLANAGVHVTGPLLSDAVRSPITLGILFGYVVGKPVGITIASWIATRPVLHGPRATISNPILAASSAVAGIGFTISLLIANRAFTGQELDEAKLGALATIVVAPAVSWALLRIVRRLPRSVRIRQLARTAEDILDLATEVDPERDHIRGPLDAPVTVLEYGDYECTYCSTAGRVILELQEAFGDDVRFVWRHLPLNDVHPDAQMASEAAEAAADQGRFWEMHEALLGRDGDLRPKHILEDAERLGLDRDRMEEELRRRVHAPRVSEDVASADESGVSGTPTFFVNGRRHYGAYDIDTLSGAVRSARARARRGAHAPAPA
jgi:Na+/H+ antiporter NhaA